VQIITELLSVLGSQFSQTNLRHFSIIVESILGLSTSVTTLSVSRMSSLSYRTVQRFYALKDINWLLVRLILFKSFVYQKDKSYLLVGDETLKGKAGKRTYGIGYFYSSIAKQAIKSVSFLAMSIIDVASETSYMFGSQQVISNGSTPKQKPLKDVKSKVQSVKNDIKPTPKGRPKGSKNKPKAEPQSASYKVLKSLLSLVTSQLNAFLPDLKCFHLVLDGFYGHQDYLLLALQHKLFIISKLKTNAHLILPYEGEQSGIGRPKSKGEKIDLDKIDSKYFVQTHKDEDSDVSTQIYQLSVQTPKMTGQLLNVVVMIHIHNLTHAKSRTVLFTDDPKLEALTIIKYYSLRFQIEFEFRDAKQFYGLADFKNYKQTQVTNAVELSFTMTLIGKLILEKYKNKLNCQTMGIIDLKTVFKVEKYAETFFKYNNLDPIDFLNSPQFLNLVRLEAIHL
jgi:putative transposase